MDEKVILVVEKVFKEKMVLVIRSKVSVRWFYKVTGWNMYILRDFFKFMMFFEKFFL